MLVKNRTIFVQLSKFLRNIIDRAERPVKSFGMRGEVESIELNDIDFGPVVDVVRHGDRPDCLVVCEHASARIPDALQQLGLGENLRYSHVAWDPGALAVAEGIARQLGASLVFGQISRLVYDCNRPPEAPSSIPERSEVVDIPGNQNLGATEKMARVNRVYEPFLGAVSKVIQDHRASFRLLVTVHSFTPVYMGVARPVEIGILHGIDDRFALAMIDNRPTSEAYDIRLNAPYGPKDGVTHTLDLHGARQGLLNVMVEIRNDLIETPQAQANMATYLSSWIAKTLATFAPEVGSP